MAAFILQRLTRLNHSDKRIHKEKLKMICNQVVSLRSMILTFSMLLSTVTHAGSLSIVDSYMACIGKAEFPHNFLKYKASLIVKNTGKENLTLITNTEGASIARVDGVLPQIFLSRGGADLIYDGTVLVKPESDLGLVELYPDEGVEISDFVVTSKPIKRKVIIKYVISSVFGGRHKNWEGVLEAEPTSVANTEKCDLKDV